MIPAFPNVPLITISISLLVTPENCFKIFLNSKFVRKPVSFLSTYLQSSNNGVIEVLFASLSLLIASKYVD